MHQLILPRGALDARHRRLISFANVELDTGAKDFATRLTEIAEAQMTDGQWLILHYIQATKSRRSDPVGLAVQQVRNLG